MIWFIKLKDYMVLGVVIPRPDSTIIISPSPTLISRNTCRLPVHISDCADISKISVIQKCPGDSISLKDRPVLKCLFWVYLYRLRKGSLGRGDIFYRSLIYGSTAS